MQVLLLISSFSLIKTIYSVPLFAAFTEKIKMNPIVPHTRTNVQAETISWRPAPTLASSVTAGVMLAIVATFMFTTAAPADAQGLSPQNRTAPATPGGMVELEAMVVTIDGVMVPAQVEGVLTELPVQEGAIVEKGQVLALIDDRQALMTLNLKQAEEKESRLNAENTVNLRDAENSYKLETEKAKAYAKIAKDGAMPYWEAETQRLEAARQALRLELAQLNQEIAASQYEAKKFERQLAEMELAKRKIVAPFGGFVEKREAQTGEWVQPGAPILQLVGMDRLRAQGFFKSSDPNMTLRPGMKAEVVFASGFGQVKVIPGVIGFVGNEVDLAQQRRVWVEFENERLGAGQDDWLYKPGMKPLIRVYPNN